MAAIMEVIGVPPRSLIAVTFVLFLEIYKEESLL